MIDPIKDLISDMHNERLPFDQRFAALQVHTKATYQERADIRRVCFGMVHRKTNKK
jgi:hypothetical protein